MSKGSEWSKETYEQSVSSRCWTFTPYDAGWDNCPDPSRIHTRLLHGRCEAQAAHVGLHLLP